MEEDDQGEGERKGLVEAGGGERKKKLDLTHQKKKILLCFLFMVAVVL